MRVKKIIRVLSKKQAFIKMISIFWVFEISKKKHDLFYSIQFFRAWSYSKTADISKQICYIGKICLSDCYNYIYLNPFIEARNFYFLPIKTATVLVSTVQINGGLMVVRCVFKIKIRSKYESSNIFIIKRLKQKVLKIDQTIDVHNKCRLLTFFQNFCKIYELRNDESR